jgi:hypothetical protein
VIELDPQAVSILTGVILPIIVGLFVRSQYSDKSKALITAIVSAVAALIANALNENGVAVITWDALALFGQQLAVTLSLYGGFFKRFNINAKLPTINPFPAAIEVTAKEV